MRRIMRGWGAMFRNKPIRQGWRKPRTRTRSVRRARAAGLPRGTVRNHELRVLVHGLAGSLELLGQRGETPVPKPLLSSMLANCSALMEMLNGALEIPGRAPEARPRATVHNPLQIVEDAMIILQGWAALRSVELGYTIAPPLAAFPMTVKIRRSGLRQVLFNLLSNAIKYGRGNGVLMHLSWVAGPWPMLQISFEEYGFSMQQSGYQVRQPYPREYSGAGLGLKICRALLREEGGSLEQRVTRQGRSGYLLRYPATPTRAGHGMPGLSPALLNNCRVVVAGDRAFNAAVSCHLGLWNVSFECLDSEEPPAGLQCQLETADMLILEYRGDTGNLSRLRRQFPDLQIAVVTPFGGEPGPRADCSGCTVLGKPLRQQVLAEWLIASSLNLKINQSSR